MAGPTNPGYLSVHLGWLSPGGTNYQVLGGLPLTCLQTKWQRPFLLTSATGIPAGALTQVAAARVKLVQSVFREIQWLHLLSGHHQRRVGVCVFLPSTTGV